MTRHSPAPQPAPLASGGWARGVVHRVPVWVWRALMAQLGPIEAARLNAHPITTVDYARDLDFVGDGIRAHRLDVISPRYLGSALPVYVYLHGGGWTSGDKNALTKYCASQAENGMVVVNVNYRKATRFHMTHMLEDADAALDWVQRNVREYGGDPENVVLGGDSAGGQIAALYAAAVVDPRLAEHHSVRLRLPAERLKGLVQHCSAVDFSVNFQRGFVLGQGFIRMLLPERGRGLSLRRAARYLSPIDWVGPSFPPVLVTTSERDYFYRANMRFIARLRKHRVSVDTLVYERGRRNTEHTWQQNARFPESQEVYRRLRDFVVRVARRPSVAVG